LLIIDEFGMRNLPKNTAEDLLEIFHRRYHAGANMIATNRPIEIGAKSWATPQPPQRFSTASCTTFISSKSSAKVTA
jgi:hypothetical protein